MSMHRVIIQDSMWLAVRVGGRGHLSQATLIAPKLYDVGSSQAIQLWSVLMKMKAKFRVSMSSEVAIDTHCS